jgi:hypothetical protein
MNGNQEAEIELQIGDIVEGAKFTRKIKLVSENPNYDGRVITVRNLTTKEFSKIMEGKTRDMDLSDGIDIGLEACKIGILNKEIAAKADQFPPDVIDQIGAIVMGSAKAKEKQVMDFSNDQKVS